MANGAANGSPTPMSAMRGGNWGNGSMYDAGSGEAMGMAEVQALLRWYQANGTYPKRTIKIGLFDNEEGGLVGSGFYSQTNVSTLAAPAPAGSTNVKVESRTGVGFAVGETLLIDPFGKSFVTGPSVRPDQATVEYLVEVCDPCQSDDCGYVVNGVLVRGARG